jgi:hypothetical protein
MLENILEITGKIWKGLISLQRILFFFYLLRDFRLKNIEIEKKITLTL